jgi:hypothetical protein
VGAAGKNIGGDDPAPSRRQNHNNPETAVPRLSAVGIESSERRRKTIRMVRKSGWFFWRVAGADVGMNGLLALKELGRTYALNVKAQDGRSLKLRGRQSQGRRPKPASKSNGKKSSPLDRLKAARVSRPPRRASYFRSLRLKLKPMISRGLDGPVSRTHRITTY